MTNPLPGLLTRLQDRIAPILTGPPILAFLPAITLAAFWFGGELALLLVSLGKTGAELLFELISQRYERGSILITSNLPFDEWTKTFGSERLPAALHLPRGRHITSSRNSDVIETTIQRHKAT